MNLAQSDLPKGYFVIVLTLTIIRVRNGILISLNSPGDCTINLIGFNYKQSLSYSQWNNNSQYSVVYPPLSTISYHRITVQPVRPDDGVCRICEWRLCPLVETYEKWSTTWHYNYYQSPRIQVRIRIDNKFWSWPSSPWLALCLIPAMQVMELIVNTNSHIKASV